MNPRLRRSPIPTGFAEVVSDGFPILHAPRVLRIIVCRRIRAAFFGAVFAVMAIFACIARVTSCARAALMNLRRVSVPLVIAASDTFAKAQANTIVPMTAILFMVWALCLLCASERNCTCKVRRQGNVLDGPLTRSFQACGQSQQPGLLPGN